MGSIYTRVNTFGLINFDTNGNILQLGCRMFLLELSLIFFVLRTFVKDKDSTPCPSLSLLAITAILTPNRSILVVKWPFLKIKSYIIG